jgi:phosphohistidine phosphatase
LTSEGRGPFFVLCYLVRHGDAVSAAENPERPLSREGRAAVERVAKGALERHATVSVIYHSGLLRAKETAELLAKHLHPPLGVEQRSGLLPEDDPSVGKAELDAATAPILLVGHQPYMGRLVALLLTSDPDRSVIDFLPATMVCFSNLAGQWKIHWKLADPRG